LVFQCESDLAFYFSADPDPGSQTNADPALHPGQALPKQKLEFLHKKYTLDAKAFLSGWNSGFWSIFVLLEPDPDPHSHIIISYGQCQDCG
jgi:hypothetical protein